jgi:DNA-binding IclR family transcriptional regulator
MGIWERAVQVKNAIAAAGQDGATVAEICAYCERCSIDRLPQSTARDILQGLKRLGVVMQHPSTNSEGNLVYIWKLKK